MESVKLFKRKLSIRTECPDDKTPVFDSKTLKKFRMCFAGRLAILPKEQPASTFKTKVVRVDSVFFGKLGCDVFMVPITNQGSPELASKSPLFCPAWHVKGKAKGWNMMFDKVKARIPCDDAGLAETFIDLCLPVLCLVTPFPEGTRVKVGETVWYGFDLFRPPTEIEEADLEAKQEAKVKAQDLKERRAAALQDDVIDTAIIARPDQQVCIPNNILKHVLR